MSSSSSSLPDVFCNERARKEFEGTHVLLTGASGGLGRALALQLAGSCNVATLMVSARSQASLQEVVKACRQLQQQRQRQQQENQEASSTVFHVLECDLSNPASVDALAENALKVCPEWNVLINNGGVSSRSKFVETKAEVDRNVMQINFFSGSVLARCMVHNLLVQQKEEEARRPGKIIWISSVQGYVSLPHRSSYSASKFAVQAYTESIRAELASSKITVHTVSPGYMRTNLSRSAMTGDGNAHGVLDATTARGADPNHVAAAILNRTATGDMDFTIVLDVMARIAIYARLLCPALFRMYMVHRYEKTEQKEKQSKEKEE